MSRTVKEIEIEDDNMWYNWRELYSWVSFLYSEDYITLATYDGMLKNLMEIKPCLPGEDDA